MMEDDDNVLVPMQVVCLPYEKWMWLELFLHLPEIYYADIMTVDKMIIIYRKCIDV